MSSESPKAFIDADLDAIISQLTIEEKAGLLCAADHWHTRSVPRLNVPSIKVTDGPNGARGGSQLRMTPALCLPCGTALGATFDTALIQEVGEVLADETKARSACVLLGPTVNIQRSPLGGRAFESFSEDPTLAGLIAAAYIEGLQSKGVAATLKHYVANDQEHERKAADSIISERALREVYLRPFQIAIAKSNPWAMMTSYNVVNGVHVSESKVLLQDILRREWAYKGLIMSDWWGTYSSSEALNAGLDLEMPGPTRWRTPTHLDLLIGARKVKSSTVDERVKGVLDFVQQTTRRLPEIVFGKDEERTLDDKEHQAVARRAATGAIVLLKNDRAVLPLAPELQRIALIGPSVKARVLTGGGSAKLGASYCVTPWEGLTQAAPKSLKIDFALGAIGHKGLPLLGKSCKTASEAKQAGTTFSFYRADEEGNRVGEAVASTDALDSEAKILDGIPHGLSHPFAGLLRGTYTADHTGDVEFGLIVAGRGKLYLDDTLVVDNWTKQRPGTGYYGQGTLEEKGAFKLEEGREYNLRVEFSSMYADQKIVPAGWAVRVGSFPVIDEAEEIAKAVKLAAAVEVPIVVVGLNHEWESEGFDRTELGLPLKMNELVAAVAKANSNTVVVVQSGSALTMPWIDDVSTVLWMGYLGNETGNALASILLGNESPSGRLSLTFPRRNEDVPAFLDYKSEKGKVHYTEGLHVGWKWYDARKIAPLFPFGHGLNYTQFEYTDLKTKSVALKDVSDFSADFEVTVRNVGKRSSAHTVLLFLSPPAPTDLAALSHPPSALAAFARTPMLEPGASHLTHLKIDKYAISHWDDYTLDGGCWSALNGEWEVWLGNPGAVKLRATFAVQLSGSSQWRGI